MEPESLETTPELVVTDGRPLASVAPFNSSPLSVFERMTSQKFTSRASPRRSQVTAPLDKMSVLRVAAFQWDRESYPSLMKAPHVCVAESEPLDHVSPEGDIRSCCASMPNLMVMMVPYSHGWSLILPGIIHSHETPIGHASGTSVLGVTSTIGICNSRDRENYARRYDTCPPST